MKAMKAIVCELCGSNDIVKQGDYFVCQHCGTKYTMEEAKKLIGTVKIDKSDETKKLLLLARRAKEENNSENAAKYYDMVLRDDPENWEASFNQVYFQAMKCTISEIPTAALNLANNVSTSARLICDHIGNEDQDAILTEMFIQICDITKILVSAATNHYTQFSQVDGAKQELNNRVTSIFCVLLKFEEELVGLFDQKKDIILAVRKAEINYLCHNSDCFNKKYLKNKYKNLKKQIHAEDPSYKIPKNGCYIATAIYGSYDCPQVWTLRRFRDYTLAKTWYGRAFIRIYYTISPILVKWFGSTEWFKNWWKPSLDRMVERLNRQGITDTPYTDRIW